MTQKIETEQDKEDKVWAGGGALLLLLGMPWFILLDGAATALLWNWFAVPQFGFKPMAVAVGVGLSALSSLFYRHSSTGKKPTPAESREQIWASLRIAILKPGFALLIGYLAHLAVG